MAVILTGTSLPQPPELPAEGGDKVAHWIAYAVLGALLMRAFKSAVTCTWWRAAVASVVLGSVFGALDEWHQAFLPTRSCSAGDLAADVIGVVFAAGVTWALGCRVFQTKSSAQSESTNRGDDANVG